ncbi:GNAT family N-acetyltransferase [Diaphorobacter aerolatus]|uniref:GNAT family N-acetyltransferase n=1 Tax=Diaphorobacter aerolatus TaxID=1288495 RepID=A0A7H0GKU8_9BURK|nr:GNAT family protein [Diaphorobacter aerolatus]QNP48914.1 GNAT family N-acetyltransferase [Diaphorobacter aerolatus]
MSAHTNEHGQPVGHAMPGWTPRPQPSGVTLKGRFCELEPIDPARHAADLYAAYSSAPRGWTYMAAGPFASEADYRAYTENIAKSTDPRHYAVVDLKTGKAVGTLSLMRIDPANGVIEVGNVMFSPLLQQTPISTEAQYLLMAYAFDELGYRRYEWKCDALNAPSRTTADRLGFAFEGVFRQAVIYKGRSRDTAWFSIIDSEWPKVKAGFEAWLSPENFAQDGQQRQSLKALRG